jgi:glycosyltransferase involved in cell wall biosynthesis
MRQPTVTVVIPTFNCSQSIALTLDSLIEQTYPLIEIVVIDAGSTDRTLEIIQSYQKKLNLIAHPTYHLYSMLNVGIQSAQGDYIHCLLPGDFYIHPQSLQEMMHLAIHQGRPHLLYCGTLLRDGYSEVKFMFRQLYLDLVRKGQQPTTLQACWFRKDIFDKIGLFRTDFHLRSVFDWLCRFCMHPSIHHTSLHRALIDYDLHWMTSRMVLWHFWETLKTIYHYFGFRSALHWLVHQKDTTRFVKLWWRKIKTAFLG